MGDHACKPPTGASLEAWIAVMGAEVWPCRKCGQTWRRERGRGVPPRIVWVRDRNDDTEG